MCRIVGYWDFSNDSKESYIEEMRDTLIKGGPDDYGSTSFKNEIYLGHRRLSIIDLSNLAHQPMNYENYTIIFNGEIYNYKSIRNELLALGYCFNSNSDTEVILKSYKHWGEKCVNKFDGIWGFAIYDNIKNKIFLSRDRFGVKPLYWYFSDDIFMFSSEIKSFYKHPKFKKDISKEGLSNFFKYGSIGNHLSIFKNCHKLEPSTNLIINNKKEIKANKYYEIKKSFYKTNHNSFEDIILETKKQLTQSILSRTVSDVKLGVFLSGGNDSSLVASILKENNFDIETFTIGFEEHKYNESHIAQRISSHLSLKNHTFICNLKEAKSVIKELPFVYDEPFGDTSAIPFILLSKYTSGHVKVALSADGGDEQFFGYTRYPLTMKRYNSYSKIYNKYLFKFLNLFQNETLVNLYNNNSNNKISLEKYLRTKQSLKINSFEQLYSIELSLFKEEELMLLLNNYKIENNNLFLQNISDESNMQYLDLINYLSNDILVKTDRASMHYGLEVRDPILHHNLVEYSSSIPFNQKFRNKKTKYILKHILKDYLPSDIVNLPKKGFAVPLAEWFSKDKELKILLYDQINKLHDDQNLNFNYIQQLLERFYKGESVVIHKLWLLLVYSLWKDTYLK